MKIGELSKQLQINIQTIKYYEKLGLLGYIPRDVNISRLHFIIKCKSMGYTLNETTREKLNNLNNNIIKFLSN